MQCVICLIDTEEDGFCTLNCQHHFHTICLQEWLMENTSCPVCRNTDPKCEHTQGHSNAVIENLLKKQSLKIKTLEKTIYGIRLSILAALEMEV